MMIDEIKNKIVHRMDKLEEMNQYVRIDELALLLAWIENGEDY